MSEFWVRKTFTIPNLWFFKIIQVPRLVAAMIVHSWLSRQAWLLFLSPTIQFIKTRENVRANYISGPFFLYTRPPPPSFYKLMSSPHFIFIWAISVISKQGGVFVEITHTNRTNMLTLLQPGTRSCNSFILSLIFSLLT